MEPKQTQPYDIMPPPDALYPVEYLAIWLIICALILFFCILLLRKHAHKRESKKQLFSIIEILKDPSSWNDNNIRPGLAVITKAARRYQCDSELVNKTEQILFMNRQNQIPSESRIIAKQLAEQIELKLKEHKIK